MTRDGAFTLEVDDAQRWALNRDVLPEVTDNGTRILWPSDSQSRELRVVEGGAERSLGCVDIVFPILHGPFGEDGTVQGMLELYGLPYVGSGVLASALGMHKHFTKLALASAGIAVAPWHTFNAHTWRARPDDVREHADRLGWPVFVKPARAGSSVGVSKVDVPSRLDEAIHLALLEDDTVLIEAAMSGREVEIAVLGGRKGHSPRASVAGEIVMNGRDFYDFDAKYLDAPGVELVCPADMSASELAQLQTAAIAAFEAIGAEGLARVDFFWGDQIVVNEINTMPGFTPISMFPRCWSESGVSYSELIDELIAIAVERGARMG